MSSIRYRPELDGLRAVAVIPVVMFHMGIPWIPGGFAGVDVFFVISGFLITSILLKDFDQGTFTFRGFWMRRVRRIAPALLAMLAGVGVFSLMAVFGPDMNLFGKQSFAALFSFANLYFWRTSGNYWGQDAEGSPLLHTWSLSVEEQFYLFFPVFMAIMMKWRPKWMTPATALIVVGSYALFVFGLREHSTATFYLPPTRAWELAVGCLLALLLFRRPEGLFPRSRLLNQVIPFAGLMMILFSFVVFLPGGNVSWAMVAPVAGAGLIIGFCGVGSGTYSFLSSKTAVFIGKISYSLYLWHWPILVFNQTALKPLGSELTLGLIFGLTLASYYLVERPTRKAPGILVPVMVGVAIVSAICGGMVFSKKAYNSDLFDTSVWNGLAYDLTPDQSAALSELKGQNLELELREPGLESAYQEQGLIHYYGGETPDVLLLGDSHGLMWAPVVDVACRELGLSVAYFTMTGVSPFIKFPIQRESSDLITSEQKEAFDRARVKAIEAWRPIVLIATRWSARSMEEVVPMMDWLEANQLESLIIEQPPELFFGDKFAADFLAHLEIQPEPGKNQFVRPGNRRRYWDGVELMVVLDEFYKNCQFLPIQDIFRNRNADVWVLEGSSLIYVDDDHLTLEGAMKASRRILQGILMHEQREPN